MLKNLFRQDLELHKKWWHRLLKVFLVIWFIYFLYNFIFLNFIKYSYNYYKETDKLENRLSTDVVKIKSLSIWYEKFSDSNYISYEYETDEIYCSKELYEKENIEKAIKLSGIDNLYERYNARWYNHNIDEFSNLLIKNWSYCIMKDSINNLAILRSMPEFNSYSFYLRDRVTFLLKNPEFFFWYILFIFLYFLVVYIVYYKIILYIIYWNKK